MCSRYCRSMMLELRQYTLRTGRRDELIDVFEREFVESQEALGIRLVGQFRDLDDPNRFVWLRAFDDPATRADALAAFYGGAVWKQHRDVANATMIDSDNVLLLHPIDDASGFLALGERGAVGAPPLHGGLVTASIQYVEASSLPAFTAFFNAHLAPAIAAAGGKILARFETDSSPNTFLALPLRSSDTVFVWFSRFVDAAAYVAFLDALERGADWRAAASEDVLRTLARRAEVLRLVPTPRSRLR